MAFADLGAEAIGSFSASPIVRNVIGTYPVGSLMVVGWAVNGTSVATGTCTDSKGNTYTTFGTPIFNTNLSLGFAYCLKLTAQLVGFTDSISVAFNNSPTRMSMAAHGFTPSNGNAQLDGALGTYSNDTASPFATTNHVAMAAADDLGIALQGWLGGAAFSGWSFLTPAGFTSDAQQSSNGTTTRTEAMLAFKLNMGATTAWGWTSSTTTTTRSHGMAIAFSDIAPATIEPKPYPSRAFTRPNISWAKRRSGIFVPRYPGALPALAKVA